MTRTTRWNGPQVRGTPRPPSPGGSSLSSHHTLPACWACPVPHSLFLKFLHRSKIHIKFSIITIVQCAVPHCYIDYIYMKTGPQSSSSQATEARPHCTPRPSAPRPPSPVPSPTTPGTSGKWVKQVSFGGATPGLHPWFTVASELPMLPQALLLNPLGVSSDRITISIKCL